jgi:hypothetical protein
MQQRSRSVPREHLGPLNGATFSHRPDRARRQSTGQRAGTSDNRRRLLRSQRLRRSTDSPSSSITARGVTCRLAANTHKSLAGFLQPAALLKSGPLMISTDRGGHRNQVTIDRSRAWRLWVRHNIYSGCSDGGDQSRTLSALAACRLGPHGSSRLRLLRRRVSWRPGRGTASARRVRLHTVTDAARKADCDRIAGPDAADPDLPQRKPSSCLVRRPLHRHRLEKPQWHTFLGELAPVLRQSRSGHRHTDAHRALADVRRSRRPAAPPEW